MKQDLESRPIQFRLSYLIAAPFLVAPLFLGVSTSHQLGQIGYRGAVGCLAVVLPIYVLFCCWMAIRHLSPRNDFRRFPFRGSLIIGGIAGTVYALQALLGLAAGAWALNFQVLAQQMTVELVLSYLINGLVFSLFYGGFTGMFFGLISGGLYCGLRFVGHSHSQATPISKKAWRRRRREGRPLDLGES